MDRYYLPPEEEVVVSTTQTATDPPRNFHCRVVHKPTGLVGEGSHSLSAVMARGEAWGELARKYTEYLTTS